MEPRFHASSHANRAAHRHLGSVWLLAELLAFAIGCGPGAPDVDAGADSGQHDAGPDSGPRTECPSDIAGTWTLEWEPLGWYDPPRTTMQEFDERGIPVSDDAPCMGLDCTPTNCGVTAMAPPDCVAQIRFHGPCYTARDVEVIQTYRFESSSFMYGEQTLHGPQGTWTLRFVAHK